MEAAGQTRSPSDANGWTIVEIPVEHTDNAICDILSLGVDAELLAPPALLDALTRSVSRLAERYARPGKQ
jgi:predicted DNA-binding transcriptional regulator YafY